MQRSQESSLKWFKLWWKFKGEGGEQFSLDFDEDPNDGWTGPFHYCGADSESVLREAYNDDEKKKRNYKITGRFK